MRKLARSVGVTAPALYRHFPSKEGVLLEVLDEAYNVLVQYLYSALKGRTPLERMQMAGQAYLDFALENPRFFHMFSAFTEVMGLDDLPSELQELGCSVQQFWHDRVRECIESGILCPDEPQRIGLALWAQSYGLISLHLRGMLPVPEAEFRQMYRGTMNKLFIGIATPEYREMLQTAHCASMSADRSGAELDAEQPEESGHVSP